MTHAPAWLVFDLPPLGDVARQVHAGIMQAMANTPNPPALAAHATSGTDDSADIASAATGDPQAFARLMARHQPTVVRHLFSFTRDLTTLEELTHETFVEAFRSLKKYRGEAPLAFWLQTIATRVGYRHWQRRTRSRRVSSLDAQPIDPPAPPPRRSPEAADEATAAAEQVHRLLAKLAERDRLVLTLLYLQDCSVAEVAKLTGWGESMVKVQAFRARAKLNRLIEQAQLNRESFT